ncbi:MAG: alpha-amylase family glycosyl hydrolase [Bacteroidales bacterium]|nr:alpha-amylase family glycosyl hydrolase [Bacteroidales bacterium]
MKYFNYASAILIFFLMSGYTVAQVVVTTPAYPIDTDSVTILFDATKGDAGLMNVSPPIYAHTGVITNLSASGSDWKYVIAAWSVNLPKALMTPLGNNMYKLTLKPSIRAFYGVPAAEQILKMAFVFRNSDGSKTGRNTDGSDIFADVYPDEMSVNIVLPENKSLFVKQNTSIPISAISPAAESMIIFVNGSLVKSTTGNTITDTIPADNFGQNWIKRWVRIEAMNTTGSAADSFSYTVITPATIAELPPGVEDGINYIDSATVVLCLYAPQKDNVFVIGDFNDWQIESDYYMNITPDGSRYWLQVNNLVPKQEYIFQYLVDGSLRIGDPYADKVSDYNDVYITPATYPGLKPYPATKTTGIATYLQTNQEPYPWNMTPFTPPAVTDLVVYELLIRDFTEAHNYPSLIDTIDYLRSLGINAIELMPIMEFEGNISWGYNPDYSFAVDKYYGTKNGLKQFIEAAHSRGIAVILDIVCNHHFGSSPLVQLYWDANLQRPAANNPWFNPVPKHPYNVGYDFNHESPATKAYMERLIRYWLNEYHVDGYRFDLSKGFTQKNSYPDNVSLWGQYDAQRIGILENYTSVIHSVNPNAYAIMEHFADNSEEKELAANNMLLWGNMNGKYSEGAGGWNSGNSSDYSWASWQNRGWSQPNLVAYMESHDEERVMYRNIQYGNSTKPPYNIKDITTGLKRIELNANFFFTIPGPKQIWQFGEMGYDYSINYPTGTSASRLDPKPIRWDYLDDWRRRYTKNIFAALLDLKKSQPVFSTTDYTLDVAGAIKRIWLRHSTMDATVLGNFDVIDRNITPDFTKTGPWYDFYAGDTLNVTDIATPMEFKPGEYRLYTTVKLVKPYFTAIDETLAGKREKGQALIYPNPSEGMFNFIIDLPQASLVEISVFNLFGNLVQRFSPGHRSQGISTIQLDLSGSNNRKLQPGVYFYRLDAGRLHDRGKLIAY